ncbi:hypothetical protein K7432_003440 [Basidiobolus ranarum]|uniref:Uncharacterized protein n=1 Tax=Basidiobolus ranarum TaxID=34480 RepID=A0ABR2WZY9_9FUNG
MLSLYESASESWDEGFEFDQDEFVVPDRIQQSQSSFQHQRESLLQVHQLYQELKTIYEKNSQSTDKIDQLIRVRQLLDFVEGDALVPDITDEGEFSNQTMSTLIQQIQELIGCF